MVRRLIPLAALLGTAGVLPSAPLPFDFRTKADLRAMQGRWELVAGTVWSVSRGRPVRSGCTSCPVVIDGRRLTFYFGTCPKNAFDLRLDGTRSPGWIDADLMPGTGADGYGRPSSRWSGVYVLDGDTLTICDADAMEGSRPSGLTAERPFRLMTFKRVKR